MIILHAAFIEGRFLVWGETPDGPKTSEVKKARDKGNLQTHLANPKAFRYDAGVEKLSAAFKEINFDFKISKKSFQRMTAWLPTVGNQPVSSSSLIGELPESIKKAVLLPWKVTALRLPLEKAVEFLCRNINKHILGPGIIVGKDLTFWTEALRFAGALVTKRQFLPDLSEINKIYFARWRPIFSGVDHERLLKFDKSMPVVAKTLSQEMTRPSILSTLDILHSFIWTMVDHLVRC